MCTCELGEAPSCYSERNRKARKEHRCVECGRAIAAGEIDEYASGVWDGRGESFHTCLRCVALRAAHVQAEEALQGDKAPWEPCTPIIGQLLGTIGECAREDDGYVKRFRAARRARLAAPSPERAA